MTLREWSHGSPEQIQDGGGRHLYFGKNINNSGLARYLYQISWEDASGPCENDKMTKVETGN